MCTAKRPVLLTPSVQQQRRPGHPKPASAGAATPGPPVVVWLRQDLRLHDNPALEAAARSGRAVVVLYIHDSDHGRNGGWPLGGAARVWLHHSLAELGEALRSRCGATLVLRAGAPLTELLAVVAEIGAGEVLWNRVYEPWFWDRDATAAELLRSSGVAVREFGGVVLYEPQDARPDERPQSRRMGFGSVGFFLAATEPLGEPRAPVPTVSAATGLGLPGPASLPWSLPLDALGLASMPRTPGGRAIDWAVGIRQAWEFGERGGLAALDRFLEDGIAHFEAKHDRFRADRHYTAAISPYVRFGELSVALIYQRVKESKGLKFARTFVRRLAWRDLAYWMLWRFGHKPCPNLIIMAS